MASKDTYHVTNVDNIFTITNVSGTQELFGKITDIYQAESIQYIIAIGQLTAGTVTVTIQEGDDPLMSDAVDVDSNFVFNSPMVFTDININGADHAAYVGHKRYSRVKVNSVSVNAEASICGVIVGGKSWHRPIEGDNLSTG